MCPAINIGLELAIEAGNEIKEIQEGWLKAQRVFQMKNSFSSDLRCEIKMQVKKLTYWEYEGSPNDPPDQGFTSDECKIIICSPKDFK